LQLPLNLMMDFVSITEYFYKFSSRLLVMLLLPITAYIWLYMTPIKQSTDIDSNFNAFLLATIGLLWIFNFILFNKKIKSIRNGQGLRIKLEKYFSLTIVRYSLFTFCALICCVSFYITRDDFFTACFVVQLILCGLLWPRSAKVSNDLKLRGDEREMVFYKKDKL
jgi:hypothetical protein